MAKRATGRPVVKVRIDDGEPREAATLRLAWGVIDQELQRRRPGEKVVWSIEAIDGSFHRVAMDREEWEAFAEGPLAFQRRMDREPWEDRAGG